MILKRSPFSFQHDDSVPKFSAGDIFTVMDAQCSLCAHRASWIARHDKLQEFTIIPLQSEVGSALMRHYGMNPSDPTSWLYVEDGRAYTSLDAFIRAGNRLGGVWIVLSGLRILPARLQNVLYRFVARNRYRLFGSADLCTLADPEVQKRLLM